MHDYIDIVVPLAKNSAAFFDTSPEGLSFLPLGGPRWIFFSVFLAHPKSVTDTGAVINMGTTGTNVEHSINSADFIDYFLCSFLI